MTPLYIARSERLAARRLAAETVILKPDDSGLFVLNEIGTVIWNAADGVTPLATIVERDICARFDVDVATALDDAAAFVEGLRDHAILRVSTTPLAAAESRS
jgi:hypothetical protein